MSVANFRLWFSDVLIELKRWPKAGLFIWLACFVAAVLLWLLSLYAKNATQNVWSDLAVKLSPATVSTDAIGSAASQTTELRVLDNVVPPDDQALKRISETALTLHSRLQQSTEVAALHASKAGRVAGLAVAMRQEQLTNNEASFWQPMGSAIGELEASVRSGDVRDGPAIGLITELQSRFVDLRQQSARANSFTNTPRSAASVEPALQPASIPTQQKPPLPMALKLLPWLIFLLPIGCLLYALHAIRRAVRIRHERHPKEGYAQVASTHQAQQMTAAAPPSNRHAAERRTQAAILQLLDEMEPLAEGDLTHEASVTEDLTGALADAFNQAVHELRRLVNQINRSSSEVRNAVTHSRERTLSMAKHGVVQAREVTRTHDRLEQMQSDVQSLSATSQQVAAYAQDVAKRTQHAAAAVTRSSDALAVMRKQASVAERSLRRLVSSTKGIETRLEDIQTASKRTDLLALNSTIHAASRPLAAEGGTMEFMESTQESHSSQNFAELATDVSSLAALLSHATRDIDQLSDVIRDEAKDSLQAMQATVAQVETTENLSQDAQNHLDEIATAAEALGSAVQEIANRTAVQAQGVIDVTDTTRVINDITHDNATALTQAVEDLQQLENLSNSLEASVHGFRLPPDSAT